MSTGEVPGDPSVLSIGEGDQELINNEECEDTVGEGDGESANREEAEEASFEECLRLARDPSMPESNENDISNIGHSISAPED